MPVISYLGNKAVYMRNCETVAQVGELVIEICVAEGYDITKRQEIEMDALKAYWKAIIARQKNG